MRTFLLLLFIAAAVRSNGQSQSDELFKQPAHVFPQKLSWWHQIYQYPQFSSGRITFFTDFSPIQELRVNYNYYYGQMDVINEHGDTLQLKPLKIIKSVQVNDDLFYFDEKKGYLRAIVQGDVILAAHTFFQLAGMEYVSGNISQPGGESSGTDLRGSPSVYDKYYKLASTWYFLDSDNKAWIPSKNALLKMFPEYREAIEDYVKTSFINFSSEPDLVRLTEFCNHLRHISADSNHEMIVRANERVSQKLLPFAYRFPQFQDGIVAYHDGSQQRYPAGLNYNLLTGEIDAIKARDTSKVKNSGSIATVNLDGTTYFKKSEGYIELILNGPVSLGVTRTIALQHSQAIQTSAKYAHNSGYDARSARDDVANFDRTFIKQNRYYLIDGQESVHVPGEAALRRLYLSQKNQIDEYINTHRPDFNNEDDLKLMISYLNGLKR